LSQSTARTVALGVPIAAVLFGIVTVIAGTRVLLGSDPGYGVYLPLLRFNTAMGFAYVTVGLLAWGRLNLGVYGAAAICALNLTALGWIAYLYTPDGPVAPESLRAMSLRTAVWLVLLLLLAWASRGQPRRSAI